MKKGGLWLAFAFGGSFVWASVSGWAQPTEGEGNGRRAVPAVLAAQPDALNVAIGPVRVAKGQRVRSVLAIGPVFVEGEIQGDVVSLGGVITLAEGASVGGRVIALGGHPTLAEGARVEVTTQLDPTARVQGLDTGEGEDTVLLGLGDVTVPADRTVALAVSLGGTLTVRGTVTQVAAGVGGDVVLEAGSVVQNVCVAGGIFRPAEGATVEGEIQQAEGYLAWLPWPEAELTPDSYTASTVRKSVAPHPSLEYSQNLQWTASPGIRTGAVEAAFRLSPGNLRLDGCCRSATQGEKPSSQIHLSLNYHIVNKTSVSWTYQHMEGTPPPEGPRGPEEAGQKQAQEVETGKER